ncbi:Programmed cell death protein 6 [Smittium culicis]|uniref:Programmed cell death protein 6 n=1 Tax=Smittium culicis TaxID=133412 RepID=A0A1R1Y297_9FUNG|nr:Programmed cell death protein 6 [Smittium culicis]
MSYNEYRSGNNNPSGGYRPPPPQNQAGGPGGGMNPNQQYGQNYGARPQGGNPQQQGNPGGNPGMPDDYQTRMWFQSVDTNNSYLNFHKTSGVLEADELQRALSNGNWQQFSIDTVRLLIQLFDRDMSGTVDYREFTALVKYIGEWLSLFRTFDRDNSGTISNEELFNALSAFGLRVSPRVVDMVVNKVRILEGVKKSRNGPLGISFDKFIYSCVMVKNLSESFQRADTDRDGWINMDMETQRNVHELAEPAGPFEGAVDELNFVCCANNQDAGTELNAVHLVEQRRQNTAAHAAACTSAPAPTAAAEPAARDQRIDLVNENDGGRTSARFCEHPAHRRFGLADVTAVQRRAVEREKARCRFERVGECRARPARPVRPSCAHAPAATRPPSSAPKVNQKRSACVFYLFRVLESRYIVKRERSRVDNMLFAHRCYNYLERSAEMVVRQDQLTAAARLQRNEARFAHERVQISADKTNTRAREPS